MAPKTGLKVCEPAPNSGTLVLPMVSAPPFFSRSTINASWSGTKSLIDRRAEGGAHAFRRDQIFVRHRQPVERAELVAVGDGAVGAVGQRERLVVRNARDDRVHRRVDARDLIEMGLHHLARRESLLAHGARQLDGTHETDVVGRHHPSLSLAPIDCVDYADHNRNRTEREGMRDDTTSSASRCGAIIAGQGMSALRRRMSEVSAWTLD